MLLHELYPFPEDQKDRKRIGRGRGSGQGCTAGKGNKGQNARSGVSSRPWFEGGQMPLARRLPKRGFKNPFKVSYAPVNLDRLVEAFPETTEITLDAIYERGLVSRGSLVKVLGNGELAKAVTIEAHKFSASALEKISKAGGTAKSLETAPEVTEG
ncbi:50S ribosomal protein L15 [Fundidesulfovibrio terrae]|uniref:50S ribosomal protein L15 n=1 Tax=Fundidesulfovibrio terrae TaxID=2922866 RepID=UPI001FAEDD6F|nr:50S ribosomal protein L15 [Fundidesulfovibrio terrae]